MNFTIKPTEGRYVTGREIIEMFEKCDDMDYYMHLLLCLGIRQYHPRVKGNEIWCRNDIAEPIFTFILLKYVQLKALEENKLKGELN